MWNFGLRMLISLLCIAVISVALVVSVERQTRMEHPGHHEQGCGTCATSTEPPSTSRPLKQRKGAAAENTAAAGKIAAIYYGWLIDEHSQPNQVAYELADGKPDMVIVAGHTLRPRKDNVPPVVRSLFHNMQTQIAIYVATDYGQRSLESVQSEIADAVEGTDAIFLDEVVPHFDAQTWQYYEVISAQVRSAGKLVIVNPGVAVIDERIMELADIVMVEHQWAQFANNCEWCSNYSPSRFMGVSSNEPHADQELGHAIDAPQAQADTRRAWALGIGWHFSCERYTRIPSWYSTYMREVRDVH